MGIANRVADLLVPGRSDLYRCRDCGERATVPVAEPLRRCPACGSADVALITRRAKVS